MPDLMTIKKVSKETGVSESAVKYNVGVLLEVLEIEERVEVLEFMSFCKDMKHRKIEQDEGDEEGIE